MFLPETAHQHGVRQGLKGENIVCLPYPRPDQNFVRLHVSGGVPADADLRVQLERQIETGEANMDYEGFAEHRLAGEEANPCRRCLESEGRAAQTRPLPDESGRMACEG
jgi:hypothetical protein